MQRIGALLLQGLIYGGSLVLFHFLLLGLHFWLISSLQDTLLGTFAPAEREPLRDLFSLIQRLAPFFYLLFCGIYLYILGFILNRRHNKSTYILGWFIGIGYTVLAVPLLLLLVEPITNAVWYQHIFSPPCFTPFQELDCGYINYPDAQDVRETGLLIIAFEALLLSWLATGLHGWLLLRRSEKQGFASE
jgi:hypothetical protein